MKKVFKIILNCCIIFIFVLIVLILIVVIKDLANYCSNLPACKNELEYLITHQDITNQATIDTYIYQVQAIEKQISLHSLYTVLGFLAVFSCLFIFVSVNPILFRKSVYAKIYKDWEINKSARQQAKVDRAEADRQAKISELEKQLEELKKDE